jgi:hypothetical protein
MDVWQKVDMSYAVEVLGGLLKATDFRELRK